MSRCLCGCGKDVEKYPAYFWSERCKLKILRFNISYSRVVAYVELERDDIVKVGDRLKSNRYGDEIISKNSKLKGKKVKNILYLLPSFITVYRPLLVESSIEGEKKMYRMV